MRVGSEGERFVGVIGEWNWSVSWRLGSDLRGVLVGEAVDLPSWFIDVNCESATKQLTEK